MSAIVIEDKMDFSIMVMGPLEETEISEILAQVADFLRLRAQNSGGMGV